MEKQAQALELRKAGASYEKIAETLGYKSASGAWGAVNRALTDMVAEPTEALRLVHYERLNHILVMLWPRVQKGELAAMDRAVGVMDRIARLYGIDAPTQTVTTESREVIVIDGTRDDYIAGLRAMKAGQKTIGAENFNGEVNAHGTPAPHSENTGEFGEELGADTEIEDAILIEDIEIEEEEE